MVSPSVVEHVSGYNSVMVAAIEKKFGKGALENLRKRATKCARFELVPLDYSPNFIPPIPTLPCRRLIYTFHPHFLKRISGVDAKVNRSGKG